MWPLIKTEKHKEPTETPAVCVLCACVLYFLYLSLVYTLFWLMKQICVCVCACVYAGGSNGLPPLFTIAEKPVVRYSDFTLIPTCLLKKAIIQIVIVVIDLQPHFPQREKHRSSLWLCINRLHAHTNSPVVCLCSRVKSSSCCFLPLSLCLRPVWVQRGSVPSHSNSKILPPSRNALNKSMKHRTRRRDGTGEERKPVVTSVYRERGWYCRANEMEEVTEGATRMSCTIIKKVKT